MKKIFASILALVAFASCSTDINDVVTPTTTLTAPIEISVAESRVFDADLNWSWESSDVIAAYQNAGDKSVNALTLNEGGNFYNEAFTYATEDVAAFHFVYPAAQLASDYSLTVAQTGVWSPILYGTVEAATVKNIGAVEMNYLSSAFELRIWENGRATRKNITKAVITSESDFVPTWSVNGDLTYTQSLAGKELALDLNGDTAIFNLGEGDFTFTLTLTDIKGETLSWELPSKNFVAGKRTILNVEWTAEAIIEASVASWYEDYATNGSSALEGGAIYVTAVGGTQVVTVDGVEAAVVDGKVSGVTSGTHNVVVTINGKEIVNRSVVVTSIPTVNVTARTSYSNNGNKDTTNDINGKELQLTASLSDANVAAYVSSCQAFYGSNAVNLSLGSTSKMNVALGEYNCYAKVTLANGYVATSASYKTHVTGVPYHADWRSADYSDWKYTNISDKGTYLQVSDGKLACIISPAFHTPDGSLSVKAAIAASTNATSAGNYDRSYIYAGNRNSSASESGSYVKLAYTADFSGRVENASLVAIDSTLSLHSSNPCVVFTAKDYTVLLLGSTINTFVMQAQITY